MKCLSPSILSADFGILAQQLQALDEAGAQYVHIDVMDGMFVPSISFGLPVVTTIRKYTDRIFDVHLMIESPERYVEDFVKAGADIITIHAEACKHLDACIDLIKKHGVMVGVAINPSTPVSEIKHILHKVDMVLVMTVNPGFGGQKLIPYTLDKIKEVASISKELGLKLDIEVDGGINDDTIDDVLRAGANIIVAGSAVFNGDITANVEKLFGEDELMKTFIIGGGNCDLDFIRSSIAKHKDAEITYIACDRGLQVCLDLGIKPQFVIGDFDSAPEGTYEKALELGLNVTKLIPEKDDTDSEAALNLAIKNTDGEIYFFGGTGTRIDHMLGNVALLGQSLDKGRRLIIIDPTNKMYMLGRGSRVSIKKDCQHGKYVSVLPYMGPVTGLVMKGFKYPLDGVDIAGFSTLTISNEIEDNEGIIEIRDGYLIVMETRD